MSTVWIGIGILILIIIAVIITVIVLNRGNTIDIINSLPHYKIYYPEGDSFVQLLNVDVGVQPPYPIGFPFWVPRVVTGKFESFNIWAFDDNNITTSFTATENKLVKMVNVIYNETGISYPNDPKNPTISKTGYLYDFGPYNDNSDLFSPNGAPENGYVFTYVPLENNMFQLRSTDNSMAVYISENTFLLARDATQKPSTFQLMLITN